MSQFHPAGVRNWLPIGGVVGLAAGWLFGSDYVLPGLIIGFAGAAGIVLGLSRRRKS